MRCLRNVQIAFFVWSVSLSALAGSWHEAIGWNALMDRLGDDAPSGAGVSVAVVEAALAGGEYRINPAHPAMAGKTFFDRTAVNQVTSPSSHATDVATNLFGTVEGGIAPGVTNIIMQFATDWLLNHVLPLETETADVVNHSWVAYDDAQNESAILLRTRSYDYQIYRDRFLAVNGLNNGNLSAFPTYMAESFNGIIVGRSDGFHSYGVTLYDGSGRSKPDLVAPPPATSWAAPQVSGAAALLIETARANPDWNAAEDPLVLKSLLMAAADKTPFAGWTNTTNSPLDSIYGAGQLDVNTAHALLEAGEAVPGAGEVPAVGWAWQSLGGGQTHQYHVSAPEDVGISALHVSLNWMRELWDPPGRPGLQAALADMRLTLYRTTNGVPDGVAIDLSDSPVDNVEYLYSLNLGGGDYLLEVETDLDVDYALAWRVETLAAPQVLDIAPRGDGGLDLQVQLAPGYAYDVAAANLGQAWTNVLEAQWVTNAVETFALPPGLQGAALKVLQQY